MLILVCTIVARGRDVCVPHVCERFHLTLKGGAGGPPPADRAQHQTRFEQHSFRRKTSNRVSSYLQALFQHVNQRLPHSRAAFEAFFPLETISHTSHQRKGKSAAKFGSVCNRQVGAIAKSPRPGGDRWAIVGTRRLLNEDLEFLPEVEVVRHSVSLSRSGIPAVLAGASATGAKVAARTGRWY